MKKVIQLEEIDTQELIGLINRNVQVLFNDFKKELSLDKSDELLTPSQVCELLQIDSSTLWRWGQKGKIIPYGIGSRRYYKKSEILRCLIPIKSA